MNRAFRSLDTGRFHPAPAHQHNWDKTTCNIKSPLITLWFTSASTGGSLVYAPFNFWFMGLKMLLSPSVFVSLPFLRRAFVFLVCRCLLQIGEVGEVVLLGETDGQREDDHLPLTGHTDKPHVTHRHTNTTDSQGKSKWGNVGSVCVALFNIFHYLSPTK